MPQLVDPGTTARQRHLQQFTLSGCFPLNTPIEQPPLKQGGRQAGMVPLERPSDRVLPLECTDGRGSKPANEVTGDAVVFDADVVPDLSLIHI